MKKTSVVEAAEALRRGKVALVPTDTVVGLAASKVGVRRVQEIKGRDPGKPIALLCSSAEEAFALARHVPPLARKLAELYWPGSLTLVLDPARGDEAVGVRVPDHPTIQELLAAYGEPLYATSANIAGERAPQSLEEVDPRVAEAVDLVVEGEPGNGEDSAVVNLSAGKVRLLRATEGLNEQKLAQLRSAIEG